MWEEHDEWFGKIAKYKMTFAEATVTDYGGKHFPWSVREGGKVVSRGVAPTFNFGKQRAEHELMRVV